MLDAQIKDNFEDYTDILVYLQLSYFNTSNPGY